MTDPAYIAVIDMGRLAARLLYCELVETHETQDAKLEALNNAKLRAASWLVSNKFGGNRSPFHLTDEACRFYCERDPYGAIYSDCIVTMLEVMPLTEAQLASGDLISLADMRRKANAGA